MVGVPPKGPLKTVRGPGSMWKGSEIACGVGGSVVRLSWFRRPLVGPLDADGWTAGLGPVQRLQLGLSAENKVCKSLWAFCHSGSHTEQ